MSAAPWPRNLRVMTAVTFAVNTGFAFVIPFLPLYVRGLGVRSDQDAALWAGVLIGVSPLLAGLVAPLWGRVADRHGARPVALLALGSYTAILVLSAGVTRAWQLLVLRAALGLTGGIGPLGLAMATAGAPRDQTGRAVGAVQAAQILSAAVGPLAGGLLAEALGMPAAFLATAVLCAGAFLLVLALYVDPKGALGTGDAPRGSWRATLAIPGLAALLATLFLVNFIGRSFTPILPAYLVMLGVPPSRVASAGGLLISVYSIAAALSATALGHFSRRVGPKGLLAATLVGGALVVLPMGLVSGYGTLLGLGVALGLTAGGSLTLCYTLGGLVAPPERRATAFGWLAGASLVGGSLSPAVAGLIARADLRAVFFVDAVLYALVAAGVLLQRTPSASSLASDGASG